MMLRRTRGREKDIGCDRFDKEGGSEMLSLDIAMGIPMLHCTIKHIDAALPSAHGTGL
jgi:hypothetical protein